MKYDFDRTIDRRSTYSYKWDYHETMFGAKELLPLWVADMDFLSPEAVVEAMAQRAAHGVFGYTVFAEELWTSVRSWFSTRHGWEIPAGTLVHSPGVVTSLSISVDCFSRPGDRIVIMPPVYYPFFEVVRNNGRQLETCPLKLQANRYLIDFEKLERLCQTGVSLLILCNPHNPGGRVWSREELTQLGQICLKYNVLVLSDEIHCDLALKGRQYIPYASLDPALAENSVTFLAPSKTFNIPGIQSSFAVFFNQDRKRTFQKRIKALSLDHPNSFAPAAVKACYEQGGAWLDQALLYIEENVDLAINFLEEKLPELIPMRPEGSYLLWVDCRKLGLDSAGLKELMYQKARVAFSEGSTFGGEGAGYLRINLACPRAVLQEGLTRFYQAVRNK